MRTPGVPTRKVRQPGGTRADAWVRSYVLSPGRSPSASLRTCKQRPYISGKPCKDCKPVLRNQDLGDFLAGFFSAPAREPEYSVSLESATLAR